MTLARIVRPWGRRGEVAAQILSDFPERLDRMREVFLVDARDAATPAKILSWRMHVGQALFHFAGVESINDAERLRGLEVQVPGERTPLDPGRHYVDDLVGCQVWEAGATAPLGPVREVQNSGGPAWLLAVDTAGGEVLIPLAAEICTRIDTSSRRIEVRLPEGLRELNARPAKRSPELV